MFQKTQGEGFVSIFHDVKLEPHTLENLNKRLL